MIFNNLIPLNLKVGDKVNQLTVKDDELVVSSIVEEHFCYKLSGRYNTSCTIYGLLDADYEQAIQCCRSADWVFKSLLCGKLYRMIPI